MSLKRMTGVVAAFCMVLTLAACGAFDPSIDNLLTPPKQEGDIYPIQQALESFAGGAITLKYPVSGEYRSAFVLQDVDGDGVEEALAVYSTNADGTVTMHLNLIVREDEKWVSKSDMSIVGNGIDRLEFADLDGDGKQEIVVGWMIYGAVDKQVAVYSLDGGSLIQRALEKYTDFLCEDLSGRGRQELVVLNLNTGDRLASAKVYSVDPGGVSETGSALLDGGATSYSAPVVSSLPDGRRAVFVDAVKGTGMLTEIIWFDGERLMSLCDPETKETSLTYRASSVASRDFNGDGVIDIPLMSLLQSTAGREEADRVYVTEWNTFDGQTMTCFLSAFMNYSDGYYLAIPDDWRDTVFLARKTDSRLRVFYSYDPETDTQGPEIFRIMAVAAQDYDEGKYAGEGFVELARFDRLAYLARIEGDAVELELLRSNFNLIE